jgi:outer membrane protein assembly factor BamE (lipoprotein component of BamABCDE complex)
MNARKRMIFAIVLLVACIAGYCTFLVYHLLFSNYVQPMPFDSAVWKASPVKLSYDSIRLRMVDDLMKNHTLEGMSRTEIVDLLGEPDTTPHFHDYDMVYQLGQERRSPAIESEWLVMRLDEKGIVTEAKITTD